MRRRLRVSIAVLVALMLFASVIFAETATGVFNAEPDNAAEEEFNNEDTANSDADEETIPSEDPSSEDPTEDEESTKPEESTENPAGGSEGDEAGTEPNNPAPEEPNPDSTTTTDEVVTEPRIAPIGDGSPDLNEEVMDFGLIGPMAVKEYKIISPTHDHPTTVESGTDITINFMIKVNNQQPLKWTIEILGTTFSKSDTENPPNNGQTYDILTTIENLDLAPGKYDIMLTAEQNNNTFTVVEREAIIVTPVTPEKRDITVRAIACGKTYGDLDPDLPYEYDGTLFEGDHFEGSLQREPGENAGTYEIYEGNLSLTNPDKYNLIFEGFGEPLFTITPKPITITAHAKTKVYGEDDPELTYEITSGSLAYDDAFTGALTRDAGENVGTYAITQGTLALSTNYDLTFIGANLTVTPKSITVTPDSFQSKIYGDTDPTFTFTYTPELIGSDAFSGNLGRIEGENVGQYDITLGTLTLGNNYNIIFTEGVKFSIYYGVNGLLEPYCAPEEGKGFKVGSTIPLKWQYTDYSGKALDSANAKPLVSAKFIKTDNTCVDIEQINDPGNSGLRYNSSNMTWQFNWQTKNLQPGLYEIIISSGESGQKNVYPILLRK